MSLTETAGAKADMKGKMCSAENHQGFVFSCEMMSNIFIFPTELIELRPEFISFVFLVLTASPLVSDRTICVTCVLDVCSCHCDSSF